MSDDDGLKSGVYLAAALGFFLFWLPITIIAIATIVRAWRWAF